MTTPSEILAAVNHPGHWDGEISTFTRTGFRPFAADPGKVVPLDIAHGLAHTFRYGGQSDPAITVAEHVLLVSDIIETLWPGNPHMVKAGLLHDAVEAYLHDVQLPLRRHLYIQTPDMEHPLGWNENDQRVGRHIAQEFGLDPDWLDAPDPGGGRPPAAGLRLARGREATTAGQDGRAGALPVVTSRRLDRLDRRLSDDPEQLVHHRVEEVGGLRQGRGWDLDTPVLVSTGCQ